MIKIAGKINSHNDRQKTAELECVKRWLPFYNEVNQSSYSELKPNYFQNEVDVYVYRDGESGRPLRLQLTRVDLGSLSAAIKRKQKLYSPKKKADLILLLDFIDKLETADFTVWQKNNLSLLANSGFLEIWLVGFDGLVINFWPGIV
jgi:hypothetical protein